MQGTKTAVYQHIWAACRKAYARYQYVTRRACLLCAIGVAQTQGSLPCKPSVTHMDPQDVRQLAKLLWGENTNITEDEAMGIADAVLNRVASPHYPKTINDVILQPNQFTPFNPQNANYERVRRFDETHPKWQLYMSLATKGLDPTREKSAITHYFSSTPPRWASDMIGLQKRGAHWFGQEDPKSRVKPLKVAVADMYVGRK